MKCPQGCGWVMPRGSRCLNPTHLKRNRAYGRPRGSTKTAYRRHLEGSRCPICRGDEVDGKVRNGGQVCWLSTCRCKCHARLRGMGQGVTTETSEALFHSLYAKKIDPFQPPRRIT